jgi:hypothetical protein
MLRVTLRLKMTLGGSHPEGEDDPQEEVMLSFNMTFKRESY